MDKQKMIRFIDSHYNDLFQIPDGGKIEIEYENGERSVAECEFLDEYHTRIGYNTYHICEFAEIMERNNSKYSLADQTKEMIHKPKQRAGR